MKKRGAALLVVVIIMFFVFFIAAIMVQMTIRSKTNTRLDINDTKAYYSAEAGMNDTINYLCGLTYSDISKYLVGGQFELNNVDSLFDSDSSYKTTFSFYSKFGTTEPPDIIVFNVNSVGIYGQTKYKIEAQVQLELDDTNTKYEFGKYILKKSYKVL